MKIKEKADCHVFGKSSKSDGWRGLHGVEAALLQVRSEELRRRWLRFPTQNTASDALALFHSIRDMMTVILRIDSRSNSDAIPQAKKIMTLLSHLIPMQIQLSETAAMIRIVWQMVCVKYGCEGLRVLGTRREAGWGLRIPEIGRTGIFSPRNNYRRIRQTLSRELRRIKSQ